jgi:hypothetical protein
MRVDELRTMLNNYDQAALKEIIVSLYKMIPKKLKEDSSLDELIQNFTLEKSKTQNKKDKPTNFEPLKNEIEQFITYADMQYYLAPNRYVRKEQRSKWRFEVKRFIKELLKIGGENSEKAGQLLADIYAMLCYACNYYIFRTEVPFSAVGYQQPDLLELVLNKIFHNGFNSAAINKAVFLTLDSNVDRETLHTQLMLVLIDILKTPDAKEMALLHCVAYQKGYDFYQNSKEVFRYVSSYNEYRRDEHKNYATELYSLIKFSLQEYDDGIDFYWKHYIEKRKEVTLYCILRLLDTDSLADLWIREYEKAVANGIEPRKYLQEQYAELKARAVHS